MGIGPYGIKEEETVSVYRKIKNRPPKGFGRGPGGEALTSPLKKEGCPEMDSLLHVLAYGFILRHRTVTRLLPPGVQVYSDRSKPLFIIASMAVGIRVSSRTTS